MNKIYGMHHRSTPATDPNTDWHQLDRTRNEGKSVISSSFSQLNQTSASEDTTTASSDYSSKFIAPKFTIDISLSVVTT